MGDGNDTKDTLNITVIRCTLSVTQETKLSSTEENELMLRKRVPVSDGVSKLVSLEVTGVLAPVAWSALCSSC